jgi:hypothetical protein
MKRLIPLVVALLVPPPDATAQTGDARALIALRATHIGALTPTITPAMLSRRLNGMQLGLRYGWHEEDGITTHAVAASGILGVGMTSSIALTAGVSDADCGPCSPALLLGIGGDMRVVEMGDVVAGGSSLSVAVSGDVGFAQLKPGDETGLALGIGAPVTLTFAATPDGLRFAPYVTPVFGVGSTSLGCSGLGECEESGTRFVIGGGIGVWNPLTSISASLGINHVMADGANPVFGVNVQIGGR